jgi:DNA-binding winged helix-turn-helix (wHTH) protein
LLQVNVSRLRHKLEPDPVHPRFLVTKPGIGYLLAVPHQRSDGVQVRQERGDADFPRGADERTPEHVYV